MALDLKIVYFNREKGGDFYGLGESWIYWRRKAVNKKAVKLGQEKL